MIVEKWIERAVNPEGCICASHWDLQTRRVDIIVEKWIKSAVNPERVILFRGIITNNELFGAHSQPRQYQLVWPRKAVLTNWYSPPLRCSAMFRQGHPELKIKLLFQRHSPSPANIPQPPKQFNRYKPKITHRYPYPAGDFYNILLQG